MAKALKGLRIAAQGWRASRLPWVGMCGGGNPARVAQYPALAGVCAALTGLLLKQIRLPGVAPASQPRAVIRNPYGVPVTFCSIITIGRKSKRGRSAAASGRCLQDPARAEAFCPKPAGEAGGAHRLAILRHCVRSSGKTRLRDAPSAPARAVRPIRCT